MTVRELRDMLNEITDPEELELPCVTPIFSHMPGVHSFDGVCPSVTGVISLGPVPNFVRSLTGDQTDYMNVFLIAPHAFHAQDYDEETENQKIQN